MAAGNALHRLPKVLPIFPLTGALLLPRGRLPLHIFEPRYRAMTQASLAGDRMIGMIQPRAAAATAETVGDRDRVYETGCAGRIVTFSELDDGRFLITLEGMCRFRVDEELPMVEGYRRVRPDFAPFYRDLADAASAIGIDRDRLLESVRSYLRAKDLAADWDAIADTPDDVLVVALAMLCPFAPGEKQALLESPDESARADLLISLLDMGTRDIHGPASALH
ncbi:MAG: peptidase S16 [Rhodospirillales bacterium]|nr:MAG: peptidase S16 [Rhodospirillales bacterium]